MDRRRFSSGLAVAVALSGGALASRPSRGQARRARGPYRDRNVIIVRFGGGVRRRETIDPEHTYSPYLRHELSKRGTLFTDMRIASLDGVVTSHTEGTLYLLTGKYEAYRDVRGQFLGARYEASVPNIFEYLRYAFDVPKQQTIVINGEDRPDEEYLTFGNHRGYGVSYRAEVLSLYRFKTYLLRRKIEAREGGEQEREALVENLRKLEAIDHRRVDEKGQPPEIEAFWGRWRQHYGDTGMKNPRGDRLLTELALRALRELRPKLMMINYQDPDYVHWGNASHYTRAIAIIDDGLARLTAAVDADPEYRDNTVFIIVPDCGRDSNSLMRVPYQHHFNTRSAHEIWALLYGPGIARGVVVDRPVDQISVPATVGAIMGFRTPFAEASALAEAFV